MLSPEQLENHLSKLNLPRDIRQEFSKMAREAPARNVGGSARDNIIVHHWSDKNRAIHVLESHTVERLRALELEFDRDVIAFFPQVRLAGVTRPEKKNVTSGTVDFMIVRKTHICFEECKAHGALHSLVTKKPDEWVIQEPGRIIRPPYLRWATERSAIHEVWTPPPRSAVYLSNLQLMYAMRIVHEAYGAEIREAVKRLVAKTPRTIDELMGENTRISPQVIASMLAVGDVHGAVRNVEISNTDRFVVYPSRQQAEHAESLFDAQVSQSTSQVDDEYTNASITDIKKAKARLAKVDALIATGAPYPKYWKDLILAVQDARSRGRNDQAVCLTNYSASGNRGSKLPDGTDAIVRECLDTLWNTGAVPDIKGLHAEIEFRCRELGLYVPSRKTVGARVRKLDITRRTLATGGLRAYHASRPASDPRNRSLPPQAKYLVLEIDSTKCDNRSNCGVIGDLMMQAPLLYSGIDGCTNEPMADAFVFGPARSDGVAILLRNYVRKHGRLPNEIRIDRGSENRTNWLKAFSNRYRIHILIMPSGGSRFKGGIENLLGRVNSHVSHRLAGSTKPDQAGRSVDGHFKSYKTARLQFRTVRDEIRKTLYGEFSQYLNDRGETPALQGALSELHFPSAGIRCELDEELLFMTSIPVRARQFNPVKGIRTCGQTFTSDELLAATKSSDIEDVRRDPEDPSLIRVQLRRGTVRAWSKITSRISQSDDDDRQFHSLYGSQVRGEAREAKDEAFRARHWRLTAINLGENQCCKPPDSDAPEEKTDKEVTQPQTTQKISLSYEEVDDV